MKNRTLGIAALVLVGVLMALASPRHRPPTQPGNVTELKVTIREWAVPTKGAHPHDPAVGPDGALWFTEQMANKLGRLDPKTETFARANIPSGGGVVRNMAATRDGRVYIACSGVDKVGIVETAK